MNTNGIETLLEKFYEGNTTLQEEQFLRNFFRQKDVPDHLRSHKPLFAYYNAEHQQGLSDQGFEQRLMAQLTEDPDTTPVILLHPNRSRFMFITAIAASILLLIGLFFTFQDVLFNRSLKQTSNLVTEIAYADASEALMMVSGNLNNGLKQVEKLQMVDKAFKDFALFHKFYQAQTIIINPDEIINKSIKSK